MTRTTRPRPTFPALTRRRAAVLFADDSGAATAEYAIATMARLCGVTRDGVRRKVPSRGTTRSATIRPRIVRAVTAA